MLTGHDQRASSLRFIAALVATFGALVAASPAHASWREANSPHFIIYSNGPESELIRYSQRLEAVHWVMTQATGTQISRLGPKVRIYLVATRNDVHQAMGANAPREVAGFYTTDPAGAYAVVPRDGGTFSQQVLFHEYAHHFMLQYMAANFPPWFIEGFAEVASTASFERAGTISWGKVNNIRQAELEQVPWVNVATMMATRSRDNDRLGRASYGQYWVVAHYLIFAPERRGQLLAYVRAINQGASPEEASQLFTGGLEQLDRNAHAYLRARSFAFRQPEMPADVMQTPAIRAMRPGEGESLAYQLHAHRRQSAAERAILVARMAAAQQRYPAEPTIPLMMARAHYTGEAWVLAEAAARQALALDPANAEAQTYAALAAMQARQAAGSLTADDARVARSELIAIGRTAVDHPLVQAALFDSFAITGSSPPAMAVERLARAVRLLPQSDGLRMNLAQSLLDVRQLADARTVLAAVAFNPHGGAVAAHARALISWIDDGANGDPPPLVVNQPQASSGDH